MAAKSASSAAPLLVIVAVASRSEPSPLGSGATSSFGAGVLGGHAPVEQSGRAANGQLAVARVVDRQSAGAVCVELQAVAIDAKHPRLCVM
jgi:hypothetical protein